MLHPLPSGGVSQRFGENPGTYAEFGLAGHEGLDLSAPIGTPVMAAHDGVMQVRLGSPSYGNYATVTGTDVGTLYAHLSSVTAPTTVRAGDIVGYVGNTGRSTGPHLHFGVRPVPADVANGYKGWVDPEPYIYPQGGDMKTTLHVQRFEPWQNAFCRDARSMWVKIVNPPERDGLFPDVPRVLGRIHTDAIDAGYVREGREGGARFVRDMLPRWRATPEVTAWELANEPDCNSNDGLAALNNYTLGAIEEAERHGLKLCVLNLPEGNPSGEAGAIRWKWEQLLPCVRRAVQGGHYVGLHAYWRPGIEGPTGRYHALGRRRYDIEVLTALGVDSARLKVLINEFGIDGGIAGGPPETGWQILSDAATYRAQIVEAERFARTVPQIDMVALFTAGWEPPWLSYDHDEAFARSLVDPLRALGSTIPLPPAPTPQREGLPEDETATDAHTLSQKVRWWFEEYTRQVETGATARATAIRYSLITLMYRLERAL